jgi:hypothetical protein
MDPMDNPCEGVIECTALVHAEGYSELDGRLTVCGILDEIEGEGAFVVYAKFEGCEHVSSVERIAKIMVSEEEGDVISESPEYPVWLEGEEAPVSLVAELEVAEVLDGGDRILWVEAVLDGEVLAQTAVRMVERYNV